MNVRRVTLAFVSSVFFAALVANPGSALATDSSTLSRQAYQALSGGDAARAVTLYTAAIESRDMQAEVLANALLNRALAYQQTGQPEAAIDDYTAALNLDAMSPELRATALYNRGLAQQTSQRLPLAIEDYTASLLLNPTFPHAFLARANALRQSGQFIFALSDYERALKNKHPQPARVYFGEAQTYAALRRPEDQRKMLQAARDADPSFTPASYAMSSVETNAPAVEPADDMQVGSISAVGGETTVRKASFPKGIEPPANLIAGADQSNLALEAATETPVFKKAKKLYTDRVPQQQDVAAAVQQPVATPAAVAVEDVPAIPVAASEDDASEPATTASIQKPVMQKKVAATAPVAEPPADETADAAPASGWAIQVASAASEDAAWASWKTMQKKHQVLADQKPIIVKADLGTKGIFYRVRIAGFDNQSAAQSGCAKFKTGGVSCYISKAES
ncbi:MAG: SPOR domain-containing protein [Aestuariivirga sp.]